MSAPTRVEILDEIDWGMSEEDEIACAQHNHSHWPARFTQCPDCNLFSAYPWEQSFGTQDGTMWAWGGVCKTHGPWTEST